MPVTPADIVFENPVFRQIVNPAVTSSSAFATVVNNGDAPVNITGWAALGVNIAMVMPMYFGLDASNTWIMQGIPNGGGVNIDPGVPTVFSPGYLHIMLMGCLQPLPDSIELQFTFTPVDGGDSFTVDVIFNAS